MVTIHRASRPLVQICLVLIVALNFAAASKRSVLSELYKQAAAQNRPLVLVVDSHSKNAASASKELLKQNGKLPFYYMAPAHNDLKHKSVNLQSYKSHFKPSSSSNTIPNLINRLRLLTSVSSNNKIGRSDDRYDNQRESHVRDRDQDRNDNYYKSRHYWEHILSSQSNNVLDNRDRNDRDRNDRDGSDRHNNRHSNDRDSNDRDRTDSDRNDRDLAVKDHRDSNDRDRNDRYRSDRDRLDQDRNRDRDHDRNDENKLSQKDNYGANVLKTLLRYSNSLNCDAMYECKDSCRVLRQGGNCEDLCDRNYSCEGSAEKTPDGCGRGDDCADEKDDNPSTRGPGDVKEDDCYKGICY